MSRKLHTKTFKTLITTLFLGLFLFANYGVNYTGLHQHEHHFSNENEKFPNAHTDCYICDFQGLSYEPLVADEFQWIKNIISDEVSVSEYLDSHIISEYYNTIQQRGPPILGA